MTSAHNRQRIQPAPAGNDDLGLAVDPAALLEALALPVYVKDTALAFRACNTLFAETVMGLPRAGLLGRRVRDLVPGAAADAHETRDRALLAEGGVQVYETTVRYADGTRTRARFRKRVLHARDGTVAGLVGLIQDIAAETALTHARQAAEQANAAKDRFLMHMSHQLRTPLNSVIGYAEALEMGVAGPLSAAQRAYLDSIVSAGRHMESVFAVVLDVAHQSDPLHRAAAGPRAPHTLCAEAVGRALPQATAAGITLSLHDDPALSDLRLRLDEQALRHSLDALLANALAFTAPGGRITLSTRLDRDGLAFEVADSGGNHPGERVRAILDPVHHPARPETAGVLDLPGSGVGLTIVKTLVSALGGTFTVDSVPGRGTTATVRLPATRLEPGSGDDAPTPTATPAG
ncbi:PAS domain-containing sensor histidine kinase [Roseospira goensis]|uniref:histidine kinase n=1 Tax=Roseospira goensis TaxID=391922 RepID=A0A7W6S231_9PROT|nr:ATP-binding protein [Roseospira goensis]MBB4287481.1 PAS domain S-box-containing protein [Roseospira goensis]